MASSLMQGRVGSEQATIYGLAELVHSRPHPKRSGGCRYKSRRAQHASAIRASSAAPYGPGGGSELVDSNMSILRKRIHQLRSLETAEGVPEEWMEWEKTCYSSYKADVAYLMADLQSHLLNIRPSFTLFLISALLSAVPVTSLLLVRLFLQWSAH